MLTKYDELLCHQIVSTFDHVETSVREWTERVWFSGYDLSGKFHWSVGLGRYPNRNVVDAYGILNIEGKTQYNVRASRELYPAADRTEVGPLSYEVLEPLKKMRFVLGENEHGLSFDIECDGIGPCHEEPPQFSRYKGRVTENVQRYMQMVRMSGWIKAEGKTYDVSPDTWQAVRDHSWGIRRGAGGGDVGEVGVEPPQVHEGYLFSFAIMQFEKWGACYHIREAWPNPPHVMGGAIYYPYGIEREPLKLVRVENDFEFHSVSAVQRYHQERNVFQTGVPRRVKSGKATLFGIDGSKTEVSIRPVTMCYLALGGYGPFRGFCHGQWMGQYFIEGHTLDLTDPKVLQEVDQASLLVDQMCEFRCGNEVGHGIIEVVCLGKYPRFGYEGY